MRAGTKPGYIFNPQTAEYFRTIIKTEIPPPDKAEIRQTILEADTKGVPLEGELSLSRNERVDADSAHAALEASAIAERGQVPLRGTPSAAGRYRQ